MEARRAEPIGMSPLVLTDCSLPFLEKGILQILSNATGGLSIVLEHRYVLDGIV